MRLFDIKALLAGIPYDLHLKKEAYYHSILHTVGVLLGADTMCEVYASVGRIDMVVTLPEIIFIFEYKFDQSAAVALEQIKERRYSERYETTGKKIVMVGINFAFREKTFVVDYCV